MARLEILKDRLKSANDIQSVVRTMKSFAAVHIRQYRKASRSLAQYRETVEDALGSVMRRVPSAAAASLHKRKRPGKCVTGIVVMGSDQGLVVQFNDRTARALLDTLAGGSSEPSRVCVLGRRLAQKLSAYGAPVHSRLAMPTSVLSIPVVLEELLATLDEWRNRDCVEAILLVHNRMTTATGCEARVRSILPPDPVWLSALSTREKRRAPPPLITISPQHLRKALVSYYLHAELFGGLIESLFSENTMRLISMELAEKHIADHLETLTLDFNQERQAGITEELLDIVAGASALERGR
jgi:F-type H+-transporting ATPase subunit gamma